MSSPIFPDPKPPVPLDMEEGDVAAEPRPSRTDAELRKIALAAVEGRIFGSWMFREHERHLLSMVFMPLAMLDDIQMKSLERDGVVHLFAEMSEQAPRSINGYPMFFSMQTLNRDEAERLAPLMESAMALRKQFMGEDTNAAPD